MRALLLRLRRWLAATWLAACVPPGRPEMCYILLLFRRRQRRASTCRCGMRMGHMLTMCVSPKLHSWSSRLTCAVTTGVRYAQAVNNLGFTILSKSVGIASSVRLADRVVRAFHHRGIPLNAARDTECVGAPAAAGGDARQTLDWQAHGIVGQARSVLGCWRELSPRPRCFSVQVPVP